MPLAHASCARVVVDARRRHRGGVGARENQRRHDGRAGRGLERAFEMRQAAGRQHRVAVHQQHRVRARGQRGADARIHPARKAQVRAGVDIGHRLAPGGRALAQLVGRVVVDDENLIERAPRAQERADGQVGVARRAVVHHHGRDAARCRRSAGTPQPTPAPRTAPEPRGRRLPACGTWCRARRRRARGAIPARRAAASARGAGRPRRGPRTKARCGRGPAARGCRRCASRSPGCRSAVPPGSRTGCSPARSTAPPARPSTPARPGSDAWGRGPLTRHARQRQQRLERGAVGSVAVVVGGRAEELQRGASRRQTPERLEQHVGPLRHHQRADVADAQPRGSAVASRVAAVRGPGRTARTRCGRPARPDR